MIKSAFIIVCKDLEYKTLKFGSDYFDDFTDIFLYTSSSILLSYLSDCNVIDHYN